MKYTEHIPTPPLDFGSLAEWVSGLATFAALLFTIIIWRLDVGRRVRSRANLFSTYGAFGDVVAIDAGADYVVEWHNADTAPVFEPFLTALRFERRLTVPFPQRKLGAGQGGQFFVPLKGDMARYSRANWYVEFRDAEGKYHVRSLSDYKYRRARPSRFNRYAIPDDELGELFPESRGSHLGMTLEYLPDEGDTSPAGGDYVHPIVPAMRNQQTSRLTTRIIMTRGQALAGMRRRPPRI